MNVARAEVLSAQPQERVASRVKPRRRQHKPSRIGAVLSSAFTWLFACAAAGAVVIVAGVFILAGTGWALIAIGVFLFLVAGLLHLGIAHG